MQQAPEPPSLTSRLRVGLGTFIAVEAAADTPAAGDAAVAAAFAAVAQVERLMHPLRAGSDLAALRATGPGVRHTVHPWTFAVLELCHRLYTLSHGTFDPCLPDTAGEFGDLELQRPDGVIQHAPLQLDLGGIAKGFAVDCAVEALRQAGCVSGLVNAGGDLAAFGETARDIQCRRADGRAALVTLRNAALASSDTAGDSRPAEHRGYYHGADRRSRVSGFATVVAPRAATADALTKCLLAGGGAESNRALLEAFQARCIEFSRR